MTTRSPFLRGSHCGSALHSFVEEHRVGLTHAAELLGGPDAVRLVAKLEDRLCREEHPGAQTRRHARALLALLGLENVHDSDRIEAGCFAEISPEDPVVEEICLLCDGLRSAFEATPPASASDARRSLAA